GEGDEKRLGILFPLTFLSARWALGGGESNMWGPSDSTNGYIVERILDATNANILGLSKFVTCRGTHQLLHSFLHVHLISWLHESTPSLHKGEVIINNVKRTAREDPFDCHFIRSL